MAVNLPRHRRASKGRVLLQKHFSELARVEVEPEEPGWCRCGRWFVVLTGRAGTTHRRAYAYSCDIQVFVALLGGLRSRQPRQGQIHKEVQMCEKPRFHQSAKKWECSLGMQGCCRNHCRCSDAFSAEREALPGCHAAPMFLDCCPHSRPQQKLAARRPPPYSHHRLASAGTLRCDGAQVLSSSSKMHQISCEQSSPCCALPRGSSCRCSNAMKRHTTRVLHHASESPRNG